MSLIFGNYRRKKGYRKGIAAVIFRQRDSKIEYLIVKKWRNWELLKGGLDGKTEEETLKDEVQEEVNLEGVKFEKIPGLKIKYNFPPKSKQRKSKYKGQDLQVYVVEISPEAKEKPNIDEVIACLWVELPQAKEMLRFNNHKKVIEDADRFITGLIKKK